MALRLGSFAATVRA